MYSKLALVVMISCVMHGVSNDSNQLNLLQKRTKYKSKTVSSRCSFCCNTDFSLEKASSMGFRSGLYGSK